MKEGNFNHKNIFCLFFCCVYFTIERTVQYYVIGDGKTLMFMLKTVGKIVVWHVIETKKKKS